MASKYFRRLSTTVSAATGFGDKSKIPKKTEEEHSGISLPIQREDNLQHPTLHDDSIPNDIFDVQKLRDLLCKVSSSEEFSETSSVSTFRHGESRKGSAKYGFGFGKKKKKLNVVLFSINDEFTRLRDQWVQRCNDRGEPVSSSLLVEFKKRISQASGSKSKPKLNFSKSELTDGQLILLIEELARRPVVAKMDLSGNHISTVGAEYLKHLLVFQLEVSTSLQPQQRVTATFLSDIALTGSKQLISKEILEEIASVAGALAVCNVQNSIYELYMEISTPDTIDMATLTAMWEELLGSGPDRKTLLAGKPGRTAQTATWSYPEAEAVIIEEYRRRGLLPRISTSQEKALDSMKQSFEKQSSFNSEAGSREGSVASDNHGGADAALAALGAIGKEDWEDHLPPKPHKRETPPSSRSSSPIVPRSKSLAESVTVTPTPTPLVPPAEPEEAYTSNIIYVPNIVHANSGIAMQEETLEEGPEEEKMEEEEGDLNFGEVSQEAQVPVDAEELAAPEHKEGDYCADFGEQIVTRSVSQDQETREAYKPPPVLQTDSPEATIESSSGQIPAADSPLPPFKPLYSLPKRSKAPAPEVIKAEQAVAAKGSKISPDKEPSSPPVSAVLSSLVKEGIEATPVKVSPQKAVPTTTSAAVLAKASGGSIADRYLKGLSSPPKEASKEELVKAEMHSSRPMNALPHKANPVLANKGQAARSSAAIALFGRVDDEVSYTEAGTETVDQLAKKLSEKRSGGIGDAEEIRSDRINVTTTSTKKENGTTTASSVGMNEGVPKEENCAISASPEATMMAEQSEPTESEPIDELEEDSAFAIDLEDDELDISVVTVAAPPPASLSLPIYPPPYLELPSPGPPATVHDAAPVLTNVPVMDYSSPAARTAMPPDLDTTSSPEKVEEEEENEQEEMYSVSPAMSSVFEIPSPAAGASRRNSLIASHPAQFPPTTEETRPALVKPLVEPRVCAVVGISRKKFTVQEKELLETLPQCRQLQRILHPSEPSTSGSDVRPYDFISSHHHHHHHSDGNGSQTRQIMNLTGRGLEDKDFLADEEVTAEGARSASTLVLRNNRLSNLAALALPLQFPFAEELDLGYNCIPGRLSIHMLPRTLLKLDLSHNGIVDFSGVMTCLHLRELNLSHNCIETIHALPKTLLRLNISHNYIWSKVCLRLLALTSQLTSLSLEGNPVTLLVPGWAAQLRSMSNKLAHLDGRPLAHTLAAPVIREPFTPSTNLLKDATIQQGRAVYANTSSIAKSKVFRPIIAQRQGHRDEERSQLYSALVAEHEEKRRIYLESLRKAAQVTSPSKPKAEILNCAKRLSSPKFTPAAKVQKKTKWSIATAGFGCGRSERDSFLTANSDWALLRDQCAGGTTSSEQRTAKVVSAGATAGGNMTQAAAFSAVREWSHGAAQVLESAVGLVNALEARWEARSHLAQASDVHKLQAGIAKLHLADWTQLPVKVRLALQQLSSREQELTTTITHLLERIRNYDTILQQLSGALAMCVRDSLGFSQSFRIIMSSALGKSLLPVPSSTDCPTKSSLIISEIMQENTGVSSARVKSQAAAPILPNSSVEDPDLDGAASVNEIPEDVFAENVEPRTNTFVDDARNRLTARILNASTANSSFSSSAHSLSMSSVNTSGSHNNSSSRSLRGRYLQELTDSTLAPWQTSAAETLTQCADLLTEVLNFSAQAKEEADCLRFLAQFRTKHAVISFAKFDKLPKDVSAALAANTAAQVAVVDAQASIRAFGKLFSQIENVFLLCIKSDLEFEPALQALMNSGLGRVVKKATQGFKAVTIVAPRSRTPSPLPFPSRQHSPSHRALSKSPSSVLEEGEDEDEDETVENLGEGDFLLPEPAVATVPSAPQVAPAVAGPPKLTPNSRTLSLDLFTAAQEAFLATLPPQQASSVTLSNVEADETRVTAADSAGERVIDGRAQNLSVQSPSAQQMDESFEDVLEFAVIDPNEEVLRQWVGRSEEVLGRAALLLNSLVDLASSKAAVSDRNVAVFRSDLAALNLSAYEPPPKAVAAALQLCADIELVQTVPLVRQRLDNFDNLFAQLENALLLSLEEGYEFRRCLDVLMRTELGVRVNESAYGIYDY